MPLERRPLRTRAVLCTLAFAVWLASALGMMHRTMHNAVTAHASVVAAHRNGGADAPSHGHRGVAGLFGDHTDAECRLYDQLSHGSAPLCVPLLILPVLLPAATFAWLEGEALARWVALFDARGPPSTR